MFRFFPLTYITHKIKNCYYYYVMIIQTFLLILFKELHECRILYQKQLFLIPSDRDDLSSDINFKDIFTFFRTCSKHRTKNIFYFLIFILIIVI